MDKLKQDTRSRQQVNRVIWNNLNNRERNALQLLKKNRDIIIKPTDKGGATVIMDTTEYVKEAMRQLQNEEYYKKVEKDLTAEHEQ